MFTPQSLIILSRYIKDLSGEKEMEKILIVDDSKKTRTVFKMLLKKYEVMEAENGQEGFKQYKKYHPNIVLMDIHMPVMNGIDATKKILAMDAAATVIIITALANINESQVLATGAKQILTKPIRKRTLFNAIAAELAQ